MYLYKYECHSLTHSQLIILIYSLDFTRVNLLSKVKKVNTVIGVNITNGMIRVKRVNRDIKLNIMSRVNRVNSVNIVTRMNRVNREKK